MNVKNLALKFVSSIQLTSLKRQLRADVGSKAKHDMRITRKTIRPIYKENSTIIFTADGVKYIVKLARDMHYVGTIAVVTGYIQNYKDIPNRSEFIMGSQYTFRFNSSQHPIKLVY
jgi:hypothetical protein